MDKRESTSRGVAVKYDDADNTDPFVAILICFLSSTFLVIKKKKRNRREKCNGSRVCISVVGKESVKTEA